ncbi:MAG: hypothetical protein IJ774_05570 [Selenomonadaceae bacterium]|nr:hypothetical protein [Selenomonadaceae bacterium]
MWDNVKEFFADFVLLAATVDYGGKLLKWLVKTFRKLKSPRRRKLK